MPQLRVRFFGRRRDAGAVAVLVGILLSSGVLLGAAALVVDVGQLYVEREQLQSGADAAAMAVALDCIHAREAECTTQAVANATYYAGKNSADGVSNVAQLCGEDPHTPMWLSPCTGTEPDNLTACLGGLPLNTRGWVQVRTTTERPGGSDESRFILPSIFARTLAGGSAGTSVGACSRVAWGTPDTSFAFTVCENLFNEITDSGKDLAPAPPARVNQAYEHQFLWRPGTYKGECDDGDDPNRTTFDDGRWTVNSDFGWEDRDFDDANCDVDMSHDTDVDQLAPDEPPFSQFECYTALRSARRSARPLTVIILRQRDSFGGYDVVGVAAFVVTGYRLRDHPAANSTLDRSKRCGPRNSVCVMGYFTSALIPGEQLNPSATSPYGTFGAAEDLGASVVQTVG